MIDAYKSLVKILPDIVYHLDNTGHIIYINDAINKLGYELEDLIGEHFSILLDEEDRKNVDLSEFLSKSSYNESETKFVNERRSGTRITKHLTLNLKHKNEEEVFFCEVFATGVYYIHNNESRYYGTLGVIRELSNNSEEIISNNLVEFYRTIIENSFEIILLLANDGTILYSSMSTEKILQYDTTSLIGENIRHILMEDNISHFMSHLTSVKSDPARFEISLKDAQGTIYYFESIISTIRHDQLEHPIFFVLHANDITERKKYEQAFEEREYNYRALLRMSPDGILLLDAKGDIIMANDKVAHFFGRDRISLIGMSFEKFIKQTYQNQLQQLITDIVNAKEIDTQEIIIKKEHQEEIIVELNGSAIRKNDNVIFAYMMVLRDVTVRKKMEVENKKLENEIITIFMNRLSNREIELLTYLVKGYKWPKQKREICKIMDVFPGTLDQYLSRIKRKMEINDLDKIIKIVSLRLPLP